VIASLNVADGTSVLRVDGVQVAANVQQPLAALGSATGAKKLIIGSSNAAGLRNLVGDLGAVIYIPEVPVHSTPAYLSAVEGHLLALKAAMA
jgi:hypothetical protein